MSVFDELQALRCELLEADERKRRDMEAQRIEVVQAVARFLADWLTAALRTPVVWAPFSSVPYNDQDVADRAPYLQIRSEPIDGSNYFMIRLLDSAIDQRSAELVVPAAFNAKGCGLFVEAFGAKLSPVQAIYNGALMTNDNLREAIARAL